MLRNGATPARVRPRRRIGGVHDTVNTRLLRNRLLAIAFGDGRGRGDSGDTTAIPDTPYVDAGDDLSEATGFDVTNLDETAVE